MAQEDLTKLTDEELLQTKKKLASLKMGGAVLIGFLIGIAIFSAVKKGIGFFTFFPLLFAFLLLTTQKKNKELDDELKSRNLK